MVLRKLVHPLARVLETAEAPEADRLLLAAQRVIGLDREHRLVLLERELVALQPEQCIAGGAFGLEPERAARGLVGEHQDVTGAALLARDLEPAGPALLCIAEFVALGQHQLAPVGSRSSGNN